MKKTIIILLCLFCFTNIVSAVNVDIPYEISWLKDDDRYLYTGSEYIKIVTTSLEAIPRGVYKSSDKVNWELIKLIDSYLAEDSLEFLYHLSINGQIINTGDKYITRLTHADAGVNRMPHLPNGIYIYDLNFNFIKKVDFDDYIMQMSYIDGFCYAALKKTKTLYRSSDFENWENMGENRGVPRRAAGRTLWQFFDIDKHYAQDLIETPILDSNGQMGTSVDLEIGVFNDIVSTENYFFGVYPWSYTHSNESELMYYSTFAYSKDGVYWATVHLPPGSYIFRFEEFEGKIIINGGKSLMNIFEVSMSDLDANVPICDTYIKLNDKILGFDTPPVREDDRLLVPMRFLFEQMGEEVTWNGETETATVQSADGDMVSFSIDSTEATVNGQMKTMDVPARLVNDKTMVPLRFLSENLGCNVQWDEETKTAIITTEDYTPSPLPSLQPPQTSQTTAAQQKNWFVKFIDFITFNKAA